MSYGFKITKPMLKRNLRLSTNWLTNGYMAVKRDQLDPKQACWDASAWSAFSGQECASMDEADFQALLVPCSRRWVCLDLVTTAPESVGDVMLYRAPDTGEILGMGRTWFELFKEPLEIVAESPSTVIRVDGVKCVTLGIVMPVDGLPAELLKRLGHPMAENIARAS